MASINIIASGAPHDIPVSTTVTVEAFPLGATSYQWEFLYRPEGSIAAFFDDTAQTTTFDLDVTGSYLIRLIVDGEIAQEIAASPETSPNFGTVRFPAGGETFEVDGTFGWARAVERALRVAVKAEQLASTNDKFSWKLPARLAADSETPLTNPAPIPAIDGIVPDFGDRIVLFGQALPVQNGVYDYLDGGGGTYILQRSTDFDQDDEVTSAALVVDEGATYANRIFVQIEDDPVVGLDDMNFISFSSTTALSGLTDVDIITQPPTDGDAIEYQGVKWVTKKHNLSAVTAPTGADNFAAGYALGSIWINTVTEEAYLCTGDGSWSILSIITPGGILELVDEGLGLRKAIRWTYDDGGGVQDYEVELTP